jgi:hypothetical protein
VHGVRARRGAAEEEIINPAPVELWVEIQDARGAPLRRFQVHTLDPKGLIELIRKSLLGYAGK